MSDEQTQPLAIDGGSPVRTAPWPTDPIPPTPDDADPVAALRRALAAHLGAGEGDLRVVDTAAGARRAALAAVAPTGNGGGGNGREIALPDLLADAWASDVIGAGLVPVPVEVDTESGAMSPRGLARAIGDATRAVVVVHPFGHPASVTELRRVIGARPAPIVEDASGALGAAERDRPAGMLGDVTVINLGDDASTAGPAVLRGAGAAAGGGTIDLDAARGALAWLQADAERVEARRQAAWELTFGLRGMRGAAGMYHGRWVRHAYATYVVRLRALLWRRSLADTVAALRAEGIPCGPAFGPPLHGAALVQNALGADDARLAGDGFPIADRLAEEWLAVPLAAAMTQHEINDVVGALRKLEAAWA